MDIKQAIEHIASKHSLTTAEMMATMRTIMSGNATQAQIGGFLIGLRLKGETIEEIAAAAAVMRELAIAVDISGLPYPVDIVGTGGDKAATFNVSTASMFVAAAAGCHVAKHGNRSVSSRSGSADVLELAGVQLDLTPTQITHCIRELGVGFMFAPAHHLAMRHAIGARRELGVRTIFNVLGPLTNPAMVPNQVLGVFSPDLITPMIEVLQRLGSRHALVVYGLDGVDEISIGAETQVAELQNGAIQYYQLNPATFNIRKAFLPTLQVAGPDASLAIIRDVLENKPGPARDVVALNAGAAIYVAGVATSLADGYAKADAALSNGDAMAKFTGLVALTRALCATR